MAVGDLNGWQAVIDPPWPNRSAQRAARYDQLQPAQIAALPIGPLLADEALVIVWMTNDPKLQAFVRNQLLPGWGLNEAGVWYWLKIANDTGQPLVPFESQQRRPYEPLLIATRGRRRPELEGRRVICSVPLVVHSTKPPLWRQCSWSLATVRRLMAQ